jgi:phage FluMu protein Com
VPITFNCPCGKVLRIADENAGKRIKCPACQAIGTAPSAAPTAPKFELVEDDDEPPAKPAPAKAPAPVAKKPVAKAVVEEDPGFTVEEDEDDKPKSKKKPALSKGSRRDEDDDDEEEEKPKKKKKRRDDDDDDEPRARRRKSGNSDSGMQLAYIVGGVILTLVGIGVAVYWYQTGPHESSGRRRPFNGYIFGGCCVFVGIVTAIKGLTGNISDDE